MGVGFQGGGVWGGGGSPLPKNFFESQHWIGGFWRQLYASIILYIGPKAAEVYAYWVLA